MNFLRKTYILLAFLSMSFLVFCYCTPMGFGENDEKFKDIIKNVRRTLSYLHYQPHEINDQFSENVFDRYMEMLDPYKTYYKGEDMNHFSTYRDKMDELYNEEDLTLYHQTVDTLYDRMEELKDLTNKILDEPFEFNSNVELGFEYDELNYAKTQSEWENNWKNRLKYNVLEEILSLEKVDEDSLENRQKSFAELEKEARKTVKEDMEEFFRRFEARKKDDFLSFYINAYTEEYDPHTTYFSPKQNDQFEFSMSGQLEGIGATLMDEKGYPTITSLVIGGPAWKQGDLEVDDKITKVAQGDKEAVSVVGMLLDDAIQLIRGKKGSTVKLTVKKKDGTLKEIAIVRDIVEMEETFVRSAIIEDKNQEKYGVIYLPSFYLKYDENGRDASDDILNEINELKKENVKGIVFDVRRNGGGDLKETVEIVGHFIEKGPVVQVLSSDGKKQIYEDKDKEIAWDGPLVVMVNEFSASASEILAAALQDYKRAVVIGSPKTYGKGTVQTVRPLNYFMNSSEEYGALKFTIQKFYRINGGSTQLKGVESDIVMPDQYTYIDISEESNKTALPWDQIQALSFDAWEGINFEEIKQKSEARIAKQPEINLMDQNAHWIKEMDDDNSISLNYAKYKADQETKDNMSKKFDSLSKYNNGLKILSPQYEVEQVESDTVLLAKRKDWHENLSKDFYLEESINILKDLR